MIDNFFVIFIVLVQLLVREVFVIIQFYVFIVVLVLVICLFFVVSLGIQWYNDIGEICQCFFEYL